MPKSNKAGGGSKGRAAASANNPAMPSLTPSQRQTIIDAIEANPNVVATFDTPAQVADKLNSYMQNGLLGALKPEFNTASSREIAFAVDAALQKVARNRMYAGLNAFGQRLANNDPAAIAAAALANRYNGK